MSEGIMKRRTADEEIRERPYEERFWMRYFGAGKR